MDGIIRNTKVYPLLTMLIGLFSFLISGFISGFFLSNGLLSIMLIGVFGNLLMLLVMGISDNLFIKIVWGVGGVIIAILLGFAIGEGVSWIFPSLASIIPNVVFFIVINTVFGVVQGISIYGRGSIKFFLLVSGLVSLVLGLIAETTNLMSGKFWAGIDLNLLVIVTSLGTTSGFCIGLYRSLKLKKG